MPQNHRSVTIPLAPESGLYARAIGRIPFNLNVAAIEECMTECVATPPKTAPNSGPDDSEMDGDGDTQLLLMCSKNAPKGAPPVWKWDQPGLSSFKDSSHFILRTLFEQWGICRVLFGRG
ncbi:hypothetical protein B0H14DRAFT_2623623 [Mycena olivaceomarginata]|nr:hypothetical protein B0H14DRAFT_2623623 [Mycena olivaceomarginata]